MRSTIQRAFKLRRWFAVLVIAVSCFAQAQSQTATITGTVTDASGAAIPKAKVTLEVTNGPVLQTIADASGRFAIAAEPGEYVLKASSLGFMTYRQPIHLVVATPITEDVKLQISWNSGPVVDNIPPPQVELLTASLTSTLPLRPLPPLKLRARKLTSLQ